MSIHLIPILSSLAVFFILANLFSLPWIIYQYRKHGYFNFWRSFILVSFLFYLMTAFFLVILPLPQTMEDCSDMVNQMFSQLKPFQFLDDIARETGVVWNSFTTYKLLIGARSVYQVIFNIFLLIPLGVYLRFYFQKRGKWYVAFLFGFALSLFFEVTQRTGIFGIYECPYRFFDVDDLMLNTLGATIGYFLAPILLFFIPSKAKIQAADLKYRQESQASYGIQLVEMLINIIATTFIASLIAFFFSEIVSVLLTLFLLIVVLPYSSKGITIGGLILRVRMKLEVGIWWNLVKRYFILIAPYVYGRFATSLSDFETDDLLLTLLSIFMTLSAGFFWFMIFLHVLLKWLKKASAPYFNAFSKISIERKNKP